MFSAWTLFLAFGFGAFCASMAITWAESKRIDALKEERERLFVKFVKEMKLDDGKSN